MSFEVDDVTAGDPRPRGPRGRLRGLRPPDLKTVDHVCEFGDEKAAWFKDPDGNVLCLHQDLT